MTDRKRFLITETVKYWVEAEDEGAALQTFLDHDPTTSDPERVIFVGVNSRTIEEVGEALDR